MKSSQARMKSSAFASDEIKSASLIPTKSDFIAKRFHPTQVGFLPPSADLIEKSTHCLDRQMCAFFWHAQRDSLSPAGSVRVGSDSPPDCHSLPTRSNPTIYIEKQKHPTKSEVFCFWRKERDSNPRNGISVHTISSRAP